MFSHIKPVIAILGKYEFPQLPLTITAEPTNGHPYVEVTVELDALELDHGSLRKFMGQFMGPWMRFLGDKFDTYSYQMSFEYPGAVVSFRVATTGDFEF